MNKQTYTKIGGHRLPPHVGSFSRVTHHLHGVHLDTKIPVNMLCRHAASETDALQQRRQIELRCYVFAA